MKYQIIVVFVICLILGTGLVAAGTLTLHLEPSLDGKGDIRATSITEAVLSRYDGLFFDPEAVVIIRSGKISTSQETANWKTWSKRKRRLMYLITNQ